MWGGSHCSAWQQKCTQSVCSYVWVGACGCMRVAASFPNQWMHNDLSFCLSGPSITLFKSEEHKRIWTIIYKGFIFVGSTVVSLRRSSPLRAMIQPGFPTYQGEMVKVVDYLAGRETRLDRRVCPSLRELPIFGAFDGSWSWNWCCTGVVCLPQVVNNNKAETKKELVHRDFYKILTLVKILHLQIINFWYFQIMNCRYLCAFKRFSTAGSVAQLCKLWKP